MPTTPAGRSSETFPRAARRARDSRHSADLETNAPGSDALHTWTRLRDQIAGQRLQLDDIAVGFRILATLLQAGLPLQRALVSFAETAPVAWHHGQTRLMDALRRGHPLASALEYTYPSMPRLFVGIVAAGEAGSGLPAACAHAAQLAEDAARTQRAIRQALAYPFVLCLATAGALTLLVTVVLPRFALLLTDMGARVPISTQWLLTTADLMRRGLVPAALGLFLCVAGFTAWLATRHGRAQWHALLLAVPGIGRLRHATASAQMAAVMSGLLKSGIPTAAALRLAISGATDLAVAARLTEAREQIVAGARFSSALASTAASTPVTAKLVRAGEDAGKLPDMLALAASLEQQRTAGALHRLVRILEPSLVLVFGIVIAGVAAALLQAIYAVRPTS